MTNTPFRLNNNCLLFHLYVTFDTRFLLSNQMLFDIKYFWLQVQILKNIVNVIQLFDYPYFKVVSVLHYFLRNRWFIVDRKVDRTLIVFKLWSKDTCNAEVFHTKMISQLIHGSQETSVKLSLSIMLTKDISNIPFGNW